MFRSNKDENKKTNLMVFIKPTIIRDSVASAYATNQKYTYIRDLQIESQDKSRRLIEDFETPVIPPLPNQAITESPIVDLRELSPETSVNSGSIDTTTPGIPVQDTNN